MSLPKIPTTGGILSNLKPQVAENTNINSGDKFPLLKRYHINFVPEENNAITHLVASNNQVVLAMKDKKILTIDISNNGQTECDLCRFLAERATQAKIFRIFLDPTGRFILISLAYAVDNQPLENLLYVKRLQTLKHLKGHLINAVAWNCSKASTDNANSTGTILVGTNKGIILQTELVSTEEPKFFAYAAGPKPSVKQVFDVGPESGPITGIEYHSLASTKQTEKSFHITITTNNRLYRMMGSVPSNVEPPNLTQIFSTNSGHYQEMPGKLGLSKLDVYHPSITSSPTRFAWLTEPGVLTGELSSSPIVNAGNVTSGTTLISYTSPDEDEIASTPPTSMSPSSIHTPIISDKPLSVCVTKFHVIILFDRYLEAICILNEHTVYKEDLSTDYGKVLGMSKDSTKNTIWVFYERAVFRYRLVQEDKNIWRIYLNMRDFDLAKKYSVNNEINYDKVVRDEAEYYFNSKNFDRSAEIFATSRKPFEEVALKFMAISKTAALKKYLMMKLDLLEASQSTQITMILAWLMEILVSSLCELKISSIGDESNTYRVLQQELDQLLEDERTKNCLKKNSRLFYGIIRNYADSGNYINLAKAIGGHEQVVQQYMHIGDYKSALEILRKVKQNNLFYIHGPVLMRHIPRDLVNSMMEQTKIDQIKLIPVLTQENPEMTKCSESMRYLEHCINTLGIKNQMIHNYLFELYTRYRDEATLIKYLEENVESESRQYYMDLQFGLRLCTELKLNKACVHLYSAMGLFDEALHLALEFDVDLAKSIAGQADSEEHQKKLWLIISERVLTENRDIQLATRMLKECTLLKIEDILPFFPDFTTMDFFKDAIRNSLQEYKQKILQLKDGTYESMAYDIRNDIKSFRKKYTIIKANQRCEICDKNLLTKSFYVFPCGHLYHRDCMIAEINRMMSDDENDYLTDNLRCSSECIFCGSIIASTIDKPPKINDLTLF